MTIVEQVKSILDQSLQLNGKAKHFDAHTALFGSIAEFDSMAVVTVVAAIEERFGFAIDDEDLTAATFETVGSLAKFVEGKLGA